MQFFKMFDLPSKEKEQRKEYRRFLKILKKEGFVRFQYSVYQKECKTKELAWSLENRLLKNLPQFGLVCFIKLTDRQMKRITLARDKRIFEIPKKVENIVFI